MSVRANLVGKVFSRLTVIAEAGSNSHNKAIWLCKCECGNMCIVATGQLNSGRTKSCSCLQKEKVGTLNKTHGFAKKRPMSYRIWANMKTLSQTWVNPLQSFTAWTDIQTKTATTSRAIVDGLQIK